MEDSDYVIDTTADGYSVYLEYACTQIKCCEYAGG